MFWQLKTKKDTVGVERIQLQSLSKIALSDNNFNFGVHSCLMQQVFKLGFRFRQQSFVTDCAFQNDSGA